MGVSSGTHEVPDPSRLMGTFSEYWLFMVISWPMSISSISIPSMFISMGLCLAFLVVSLAIFIWANASEELETSNKAVIIILKVFIHININRKKIKARQITMQQRSIMI